MKQKQKYTQLVLLTTLLFFIFVSCSTESTYESSSGSEKSKKNKTSESNFKAPEKPVSPDAFKAAIKEQNEKIVISEARKLLSQGPDNPQVLNALSLFYYQKGKKGLAQIINSRAQKATPKLAGVFNNAGVFVGDDDPVGAAEQYKTARQQDSSNFSANANLASIYTQYRMYDKALVFLERLYDKNPDDPGVAVNYAIGLRSKGDYSKSEQIYKKILEKNPNHKLALFNYAILLVQYLNKPQEGLDRLNALKFLNPSGSLQGAMENLEKIAQTKPK